jgi:hypothetical protein
VRILRLLIVWPLRSRGEKYLRIALLLTEDFKCLFE